LRLRLREIWGKGKGIGIAVGVAMGLRPYNSPPLNLSSLLVVGLRVGVEQSRYLSSRYGRKKPAGDVGVGGVGMSNMLLYLCISNIWSNKWVSITGVRGVAWCSG
jgi:hypothetical protein